MTTGTDKKIRINLVFRLITGAIVFNGLMFAAIFISAGRWDFWQGWAYLAIWIYAYLVTFIIIPSELITERNSIKQGTKKWDLILLYVIATPLNFITPLVAALDGGRFHWTGNFPVLINILALILVFSGYSLMSFCLWKNRFFSSFIRIQKDRGHYVIDKGPYALIRHPGYAGQIISFLSTGFALNSLWAFIPAGLLAITFIIRTYLEDITLKKELSGYKEYTTRVRYRLLPGIW